MLNKGEQNMADLHDVTPKFWKWLDDDECKISTVEVKTILDSDTIVSERGLIYFGPNHKNQLPKQMLIGYMMDYLRSNFKVKYFKFNDMNTDAIYDHLKNQIESKEQMFEEALKLMEAQQEVKK